MKIFLAVIVTILLGALIHVGNVAWWFEREVVDLENFVDSTVAALDREDSRDAMSRLIVDQLVDEYPLLIVVDANLVGMFSGLMATEAFGEIVRSVGADVHERMLTGNQDAVAINLEDHRAVIVASLDAVAPRLVDLAPDDWFVAIEVIETGVLPNLSFDEEWAGVVLVVAIIGAAVLTVLLLRLVKRRAIGVALVGAAFLLAAIATGALVQAGRRLTTPGLQSDDTRMIAANVYNQLTEPLRADASVLTVVGAALIALGIVLGTAVSPTRMQSPGEG